MAEHKITDNTALLRRLLGLAWPHRWMLLPALVAMAVLAATNGAIAFLVQPILDNVFIQQDKKMLYIMPFVVLGVFTVQGVAYFVQSYCMEYVGQHVVRGLQVAIYRHLLALDMNFYLNQATGSLISRVTFDTQLLKGAASSVLTQILREGLTVVFLIGVLFYRDAELAAIAMIGLPGAGFLIARFGRRMRRLGLTGQLLNESISTHLEQTFSGLRIVKAFGMESRERAVFRRISKMMLKNGLRTAVVQAMSNPSMDLVAGLAVSGVILYGGQAVINGGTTTGAFFSFITALLLTYNPIKRFTGLNNSLQTSMSAAQRIFELLDIKPTIVDAPNALTLPPIRTVLSFRNVTFSYGGDRPQVLNGINLEVRAGERVALVGRSGSGKTTLVSLVPRFFDVTGGEICIDGVDIRHVSMRSLRAQIAMVTQEVILFNDTVFRNIAYGDPRRSEAEVEQAAVAANALGFIQELPQGFATEIGDRGVRLSGGQRQRLSIARSLLRNAPILILDEATSSLDTESELAVQEALERLMAGRTTLVIAHRLSTIQNADRIVVLREGAIVEEGSHKELLALGGEYARLYTLQFREEENEQAAGQKG